MRRVGTLVLIAGVLVTARLLAHSASGAIYTTLGDGSEVNFNIYDAKEDVHLNGGPGPGAPPGAAAFEDGDYVFQVTDPSGKTLLSEDLPECRVVTVSGGVFANTNASNREYKVWVTPLADFIEACDVLTSNDCDGFVGGHTKTDNFKVRGSIQEIDTRFFPDLNRNGIQDLPWEAFIDGLGITWFDTVGGSNRK